MVSTGGRLVACLGDSNSTHRYVGGSTIEWATEAEHLRDVVVLREELRQLNVGDGDINIFFEVVNFDGLRLIRPVQRNADARALVERAIGYPWTHVYVIPADDVANELNAAVQPESAVISGDKTTPKVKSGYESEDSVHN